MFTFPPHLTIMGDFEIKDKNVDFLVSDLSEILSKQGRIFLETTTFEFYPWKMVSLAVKKTPEMKEIHYKVMEAIQQYRTAWIPEPLLKDITNYSEKQQEYIRRFGYQFAYEYFSPHFGLAGNDIAQEVFDEIKLRYSNREEIMSITLEKIVLIDRENNNQSIATFSLA